MNLVSRGKDNPRQEGRWAGSRPDQLLVMRDVIIRACQELPFYDGLL